MIFQHQSKVLLLLIIFLISKFICQVSVINNVLHKCLCLCNSLQYFLAGTGGVKWEWTIYIVDNSYFQCFQSLCIRNLQRSQKYYIICSLWLALHWPRNGRNKWPWMIRNGPECEITLNFVLGADVMCLAPACYSFLKKNEGWKRTKICILQAKRL